MLNKLRNYPLNIVSLALLGAVLWLAVALWRHNETRTIVIAAGPANSESHVLMGALKAVTDRYHPEFKIVVHETAGTVENVKALERNEAQFGTAQADGMLSPNSRTVSVLFDDYFQLLAHAESGVTSFVGLKGKRIALPRAGGQYESFLFVASHFGLHEADFKFVGPNDESADLAYAKNDADAVFRVRALNNASMARLAASGNSIVVPIEQGAALHIRLPAYSPAVIPKGTYTGFPATPDADTNTVSAPRYLMARRDVDDEVVFAITEILMERRPDLLAAIPENHEAVRPLAANAAQPNTRTGLGSALHPGARAYYERDTRLPFISRNGELIAASVAVAVLVALWFWALGSDKRRTQHAALMVYHARASNLIGECQTAKKPEEFHAIRTELMEMLPASLQDKTVGLLSSSGFASLQSLIEFGLTVVRDRQRFSQSDPKLQIGDGVAKSWFFGN